MTPDDTRRRKPRIWDTDWLVLRELAILINTQVGAHMKHGQKILDLGCGSMPYRTMIQELGVEYSGADIDPGSDLLIDSHGKVPLAPASVDAVLSVQVLEHVRDLDSYCKEIYRLLDDDGTLFLSTHGTWLYHPHPEDHRRWTVTGLREDLETRGFRVHELFPIVGPLATTTLIRLTGFAFMLRKIPAFGTLLAKGLSIVMNLRAALEDKLTPQSIRRDNACVYLVRASKIAA